MDPSIASLFQAFSLSMQQQQSNDRKEALATKALQAVVNKIDQFDGRNISRYLRCYVREMELNRVSEKKMVALFGLATIPEIRDHITSITDRCGNSWEDFSHALKDEYFLEDAERVTKKLFLGWIERPNKNLQATELLREFERQYSQLSKVEKLTLELNKVDLFLQAADGELQDKLKPLLEDKEEDEGLTTKWKNVEDAVGLLTKKERRKIGAIFRKQYKHPKLQYVQHHRQCLQFNLRHPCQRKQIWGIICWKDGKIALKDREDLLQTNFGKAGMRALVQDYLKEHETAAQESTSYGARVDDEIGGSTETTIIRGRTGWEDSVESLSVHAYIAKSQHEALMEEKRRGNFDDTREGNSFKRQTRGDKAREAASQELPVKDTSASLGEKTTVTKDKNKSIAYKLLSDIEAATNLKGVLEERILNAKMEFTLKEVLGIAKKEFHDVIIDSIKRKKQLMSETGMSHANDARICRDEEEVDIGYKQPTNEKNGYNQRRDYGGTKEEVLSRDEGAFDASFIGILENGNIMYKKVDDFKKKERKRLYDIEGQLCKIGTLQDDERILDVYEENGLEDSLELITSIGLGDNDKIVDIHSREVYTMLESFQAPEVTVEKRYKTADKKDSKEQMGEASKEASLRDSMSIGHQFTEETFEELKIGSDGSLLPEEITCFKKMLAKQGRSFAFESHEIGCVDSNIITPMVIFTVPHVPWNLRPIQYRGHIYLNWWNY
uniref:Predicted protein n=1 Tax=Physcomitrium patens TaxID=3218 RepID=A9U6H8_PHYPA